MFFNEFGLLTKRAFYVNFSHQIYPAKRVILQHDQHVEYLTPYPGIRNHSLPYQQWSDVSPAWRRCSESEAERTSGRVYSSNAAHQKQSAHCIGHRVFHCTEGRSHRALPCISSKDAKYRLPVNLRHDRIVPKGNNSKIKAPLVLLLSFNSKVISESLCL